MVFFVLKDELFLILHYNETQSIVKKEHHMILFLGFGRVAHRFVQTMKTQCVATSRNPSKSFEPFVHFIPFDKTAVIQALHQATYVISSIAPSDSG